MGADGAGEVKLRSGIAGASSPRAAHTALVIDPKGENAEATWTQRVAMGHRVAVPDPFNEAKVSDEVRVMVDLLASIDRACGMGTPSLCGSSIDWPAPSSSSLTPPTILRGLGSASCRSPTPSTRLQYGYLERGCVSLHIMEADAHRAF